MTSREFRDRLLRRARRAHTLVDSGWIEPLEHYFQLLARWNAKINLTGLPLQEPTDQTFDRLLIEPLGAAGHVAARPDTWWDLGSGGGSPAIPLKIAKPLLSLTMVEGKARKAAFLREATRVLQLSGSEVLHKRFDEVAASESMVACCELVTVRAVRADRQLFGLAARLLRDSGQLFLFRPTHRPISATEFRYVETAQLTDMPRSYLGILERVPRGTSGG